MSLKLSLLTAAFSLALTCAVQAASPVHTTPPPAGVGPNGEVDGLSAKFVDVNGVSTRYYDYGSGAETVLLLHGGVGWGGSSTANNWSRNIPVLSKKYRVLAIDRLAQGLTEGPVDDKDLSNDGNVAHVKGFIDTMKLGKVHLVGHSSGHALAFYTALTHPDIIKTLTIVSFGPGMPMADLGRTKFDAILDKCPPDRQSYEHRLCRLLALGNTPETFPPDYSAADEWMGAGPRATLVRERVAALRKAGKAPGGYPEYNKVMWEKARNGALKMPILIFTAKEDSSAQKEADAHDMLTGELNFFDIVGTKNDTVQMIVVNRAGHFPYREQPELFNAGLDNFISFWNANGDLLKKMQANH